MSIKKQLEDQLEAKWAEMSASMTEAEWDALLPVHYDEWFINDPHAQAWAALCDILIHARRDDRIRKSDVVLDFISVVSRVAGDFPKPGTEFNDIGEVMRAEMAKACIKLRRDQKDKQVFQAWIQQSGIKVDRITDFDEMRASTVPEDVRLVIAERNKEVIRDWYKEIHPGPLKPGRKKTSRKP